MNTLVIITELGETFCQVALLDEEPHYCEGNTSLRISSLYHQGNVQRSDSREVIYIPETCKGDYKQNYST